MLCLNLNNPQQRPLDILFFSLKTSISSTDPSAKQQFFFNTNTGSIKDLYRPCVLKITKTVWRGSGGYEIRFLSTLNQQDTSHWGDVLVCAELQDLGSDCSKQTKKSLPLVVG